MSKIEHITTFVMNVIYNFSFQIPLEFKELTIEELSVDSIIKKIWLCNYL